MPQASSKQLIALIQSTGDRAAFNELFTRYDTNLRAFLRAKSGEENIDDIVQETYVKAFLNIDKFELRANYTTWLFKIAFNELLQSKRKISVFRRLKENVLLFMKPSDGLFDNTCLLIDAEQAIAELSTVQQQVFVYSELFGCSHAEISENLNLPLGSVKTYIKQARIALEQGNSEGD